MSTDVNPDAKPDVELPVKPDATPAVKSAATPKPARTRPRKRPVKPDAKPELRPDDAPHIAGHVDVVGMVRQWPKTRESFSPESSEAPVEPWLRDIPFLSEWITDCHGDARWRSATAYWLEDYPWEQAKAKDLPAHEQHLLNIFHLQPKCDALFDAQFNPTPITRNLALDKLRARRVLLFLVFMCDPDFDRAAFGFPWVWPEQSVGEDDHEPAFGWGYERRDAQRWTIGVAENVYGPFEDVVETAFNCLKPEFNEWQAAKAEDGHADQGLPMGTEAAGSATSDGTSKAGADENETQHKAPPGMVFLTHIKGPDGERVPNGTVQTWRKNYPVQTEQDPTTKRLCVPEVWVERRVETYKRRQ